MRSAEEAPVAIPADSLPQQQNWGGDVIIMADGDVVVNPGGGSTPSSTEPPLHPQGKDAGGGGDGGWGFRSVASGWLGSLASRVAGEPSSAAATSEAPRFYRRDD